MSQENRPYKAQENPQIDHSMYLHKVKNAQIIERKLRIRRTLQRIATTIIVVAILLTLGAMMGYAASKLPDPGCGNHCPTTTPKNVTVVQ